MKLPRVKSLSGLSDADFEQKAQHIAACIAARSAYFPTPNPSLGTVQDAVELFSERLLAAANLGRTEIALKNEARQNLDANLVQLGTYVMNAANGNLAILTSSGYNISKPREFRIITNPGAVKLVNGRSSGEIIDSVKRVSGASGYSHEITDSMPEGDIPWKAVITTTAKYTHTNLTPGKQYWVRVAAIGARNQIAYSPVSTLFAQ